MRDSEIVNSTIEAPAAKPASPGDLAGFRDQLRTLLAEATALANQLRKTSTLGCPQEQLSAGAWSILRILDHSGSQTVPGIARIRSLSRQNIQVVVNRLQARSLVALTANPAHKRSSLVQLAERAKRLLAAGTQQETRFGESLLPHVSEARLARAAKALRRLRSLLASQELPPEETTARPPTPRPPRAQLAPARPRKTLI